MKDVFERIDSWDSRLNIFRDPAYLQHVTLWAIFGFLILWVLLGYDSGISMLEIWQNDWQPNWAAYGKSMHFSSIIFYGLLFVGMSRLQKDLGIKGSKNTFYSVCLTFLNIAIFEWVYMILFTRFQLRRNLIEWFFSDLWFLQQYLWILIMGLLALLCLYLDSFRIENREVVGRNFAFKPSIIHGVAFFAAAALFFLWVCYPLPIDTAVYDGWQSSSWFPQTHYAYVGDVYVPNYVLHTVNISAKAMLAIAQLVIFRGFRRGDKP